MFYLVMDVEIKTKESSLSDKVHFHVRTCIHACTYTDDYCAYYTVHVHLCVVCAN